MKTILDIIADEATSAIKKAFPEDLEHLSSHLPAQITQSSQEQFGHYQCNSAMQLSKALKKNPREIASSIVAAFTKNGLITNLEIAGPGFINIWLSPKALSEQLSIQLHDERLGVAKLIKKKRIIVECSSPNVAKELHVGHLRSTIIGDSIARLYEFLGHDVLRLNHIGDWGTQFGMLIAYIKTFHPEIITNTNASLATLMDWYKQAKAKFDADPEFKTLSQEQVVALQSGDETARKVWQAICEISRRGYQEIYDLLDVHLIERGESFYNPYLKQTVDELSKKGLVTVDDGAKCIFLEGFKGKDGKPFPMILQKRDGGFNYSTTDMATIKYRLQQEEAEKIIHVVDAGQKLHFDMVFAAAEKAGYLDPSRHEVKHVTFGVVLGSDGKKFKTRSGETEKLIDLITQAVDRAYHIMKERLVDISEDKLKAYAQILGIDAIKYADLSCHRQKDYTFSYDRMLKFEGNTAAFLLYSYVRIQSIKRKFNGDFEHLVAHENIHLEHESEVRLGLHLRQFPEALALMDEELLPNRLCDYLYGLAEKFNGFFRDCQVIGSKQETSRLLLAELTGRVLAKGLSILGLKTLPRM